MYRRSVAPVFMRGFVDDIMGALTTAAAAGALLATASLDLWTGAHVPSADSLDADMPDAAFDGYAADAALVWTPAGWGQQGQESINSSFFQAGAALVDPGVICTGYKISIGGVVVIAERFITAVNFDEPGKFLDLDIVLNEPFIRAIGGPG